MRPGLSELSLWKNVFLTCWMAAVPWMLLRKASIRYYRSALMHIVLVMKSKNWLRASCSPWFCIYVAIEFLLIPSNILICCCHSLSEFDGNWDFQYRFNVDCWIWKEASEELVNSRVSLSETSDNGYKLHFIEVE